MNLSLLLSRFALGTLVAFTIAACQPKRPDPPDPGNPPGPCEESCSYTVEDAYPHDRDAFTQGLVYHDGYLYEGTGLRGQSTLRKVAVDTGEVVQQIALDDAYFGEGIVLWEDRIVQLTWTSGIALVYDRVTFEQLDTFTYEGQGWGITHDGASFIMSDGSDTLYFRDPDTFEETRRVQVSDANGAVSRLNELEYIDGQVFANVWQTDRMVRIDPATGAVTATLDLAGLLPLSERIPPVDVLNGIAYDEAGDRLLVTGKLWPKIYHVDIFEEP